ncbi:ABC transporter substrate-binding protein [Paeniglutamicibacter sp. Y32M11]|uniref:ABC transporter substrate-binding protein n=1 Tax=Paeniglutamicibacter sp. Y32M11 TaxID=2853258 RepID=UPI001C5319C1|nr:ABC transporter substrate-binding protein [Paeniglutamicibacter sp. Y32M11]QXQ11617.1 ABC transporter substrate-binding protein [Paeniglutamicibacter sp. Y32M11]
MIIHHQRALSVLGAATLLAVTLTGCSSTAKSSAAANTELTGPATAEELTIALDKDTGPINLFSGASDQLIELVYDKLLSPSPYVDEPQPWLATQVRQIDPGTWEADLRTDVSWQDGVPFTPDDVVFSFAYMHQAPTGRYTHHVNDTPYVERAVKVDADTVRFECRDACPDLARVTLADLPIVAEHIWTDIDAAEAKTIQELPIGTGPYQLTSYSPTEGYTFTANKDYFAGEPTVKTLTMPVITDQSATFTALQSGEIDATTRKLTPELVSQFDNSPNVDTIATQALSFPEIKINYLNEPMDNGDFRKALSNAINKEQMLDVVALGQGRTASSGYPHPDAPFANPDNSTPTDPDASIATFDGLGYTDTDGDGIREIDGEPIILTTYVNSGLPQDVRAAELAKEDLEKVGIGIEIEGMDAATLTERSAKKSYDLLMSTIGAHGVADSDQFVMSHRAGYLWTSGLAWEQWDETYAKWLKQTTHNGRLAVLQDLQTIQNEAPTTIPLYYPEEHWAVSQNYGGWVESPGYGIMQKWSFLPADVVTAAHSGNAQAIVELTDTAPAAEVTEPPASEEHQH